MNDYKEPDDDPMTDNINSAHLHVNKEPISDDVLPLIDTLNSIYFVEQFDANIFKKTLTDLVHIIKSNNKKLDFIPFNTCLNNILLNEIKTQPYTTIDKSLSLTNLLSKKIDNMEYFVKNNLLNFLCKYMCSCSKPNKNAYRIFLNFLKFDNYFHIFENMAEDYHEDPVYIITMECVLHGLARTYNRIPEIILSILDIVSNSGIPPELQSFICDNVLEFTGFETLQKKISMVLNNIIQSEYFDVNLLNRILENIVSPSNFNPSFYFVFFTVLEKYPTHFRTEHIDVLIPEKLDENITNNRLICYFFACVCKHISITFDESVLQRLLNYLNLCREIEDFHTKKYFTYVYAELMNLYPQFMLKAVPLQDILEILSIGYHIEKPMIEDPEEFTLSTFVSAISYAYINDEIIEIIQNSDLMELVKEDLDNGCDHQSLDLFMEMFGTKEDK